MTLGGLEASGAFPEDSAGMRYRPLGNTGLRVSEVSFGTYGFSNPALLTAALDRGINLICTCADYQDGRAEEAVGRALKGLGGRRDELIVYTGTSVRAGRSKEDILRTLDQSLKRLNTDRVEIFKTHNVDDPAQLKVDELFEAFEEAKKAGKVKHLGLSGHGRKLSDCLKVALDDGRYKAILCRYDFVSYKDEQEKIFHRAAGQGMGSIVFKVNAGHRESEVKDLQRGGLSFTQATVKWALSNPDVSSVCAGITNFDQIDEYCGAVGKDLERAEVEMLERYAAVVKDQYCRNCGNCEASCPRHVAVADIMRYAMYFKYYAREKDSMRLYAALPREVRAQACLDCEEVCQGACLHGRQIRTGLLEAHEMLT
jgi:aryl-alcohol dehydrogenase-like predicted oxidoreductase